MNYLFCERCTPHRTDLTYLELGALDGKLYSNTLLLEQRSWSGLLIEGVPANAEKLQRIKQNHPKTKQREAAASAAAAFDHPPAVFAVAIDHLAVVAPVVARRDDGHEASRPRRRLVF